MEATMTTPPEQPTTTTDDQLEPALLGPEGFSWGPVPDLSDPTRRGERLLLPITPPDLGPLKNFTGTFRGHGFNQIFRPQNPASPADLPTPVPDSDNVLELNLTEEFLSFSKTPIATDTQGIPNRGEVQGDIFLNGVGYLQVVNDITNGQANKVGIHFELGEWVIIPSTSDPFEPGTSAVAPQQTLVRMGSIPHGTTINAQGTFSSVDGPPTVLKDPNNPNAGTKPGIPTVDITPFVTGSQPPQLVLPPNGFPSQTAANPNTPRIPQDLTNFKGPNGITAQDLLDNPNTLLNEVVVNQSGPNLPKILSTTTISITTNPATLGLFGGGADNIAFLLGDPSALTLAHEQQQGVISAPPPGPGPNAQALSMQATFWIETVESNLVVKAPLSAGETKTIPGEPPLPGLPPPRFQVTPPFDITQDTTITVQSTQIQYSQVVFLVFGGRFGPSLVWPHVSVNTLVPFKPPVVVPPTAFQ
jgi:hypothetical protein